MATVKRSRRPSAKTAQGNQGQARTVIYCHGIMNKPPEEQLRAEWDQALFGQGQGERTRMAYWVDRGRYPTPSPARTRSREIDPGVGSQDRLLLSPGLAEELLIESIASSDNPGLSDAAVEKMKKELLAAATVVPPHARGPGTRAVNAQGVFSPIVAIITKLLLADVNDFLFNADRRKRMVDSVKDRMETGGGPFVVIGHSQGSMVAYQALVELGVKAQVDLFVTIGSPLGLSAVTTELKKWHGKKLPVPPGVKRWVNISRSGDIVCADPKLADDYASAHVKIEDHWISDHAGMPAAHDSDYYLAYAVTKDAVMSAVDRARFQPVSGFTIARDLAGALDATADTRVPVLIELRDPRLAAPLSRAPQTIDAAREMVLGWIDKNIGASEACKDRIHLEDKLDRYVAAHLTRKEVETMAAGLGQYFGASAPAIYRMFQNSRKRALIRNSVQTIQARTARIGYAATGRGITWAVLDTGIDRAHPHFKFLKDAPGGNIAGAWDCTRRGEVQPDQTPDSNGHGTHVAGIIAGGMAGVGAAAEDFIAVAPETRLVTYKVLADDGGGNDAWIIKAIDHIYATNEKARGLAIQGVNLSLGGPFDAASFGCGDSPLCSSLRRLVGQGVIVVVAAGNEGIGRIAVDGRLTDLSLDLSIGDPANLEEAVSVGSVHPQQPHRYGTSYFSSRGPTADGRAKPDVVAPGERILSCRSGGRGQTVEKLYIELSGTSMAAPHVSGLLAAYLSSRREFIGQPARVKEILMEHCTDLRRDRYHQGAGLPNLTRMLLQT